MATNNNRFRRPVRFNRNRANPMQRLPFYRPSTARRGDYWRMPPVQGYLTGKEVGRICALAYLQSLGATLSSFDFASSGDLAQFVLSAIHVHGGQVSDSERGIIDGFFGSDSPLTALINGGVKAHPHQNLYEIDQLEEALTELSALSAEEYGLLRRISLASLIPESRSRPKLSLQSPAAGPAAP